MAQGQQRRVKLGSLVPFPGNAKAHDMGAIVESLEKNGQYRPLVVQQSTMQVLAGNGTLEAMQYLGWDECDVWLVDCDDETAVRINIVDNRANELGDVEYGRLARLLEGLGSDTVGTGYTSREVTSILSWAQEQADESTKVALEAVESASATTQAQTRAVLDSLSDNATESDTAGGEEPEPDEGLPEYEEKTIHRLDDTVQFLPSSAAWEMPELRDDMLLDRVPDDLETWSGPNTTTDRGQHFLYVFHTDSTVGMPFDRSLLAFYTSDERFANWWADPSYYVERLVAAGYMGAIEPDYSVGEGIPQAVNLYNVYRNRWCARFMQEAGVKIIPNISISGETQDHEWLYAGIPVGVPVVALQVQALVENDQDEITRWLRGMTAMLKPGKIIAYGNEAGHTMVEKVRLKTPVQYVLNRSAKLNQWREERDAKITAKTGRATR